MSAARRQPAAEVSVSCPPVGVDAIDRDKAMLKPPALDIGGETVELKPMETTETIAELLNVSKGHVRKMAQRGDFGDAAKRVGNTWRFNTAKIRKMYGL